ncbi:methylamine utilization protein [Cellvibrio fontiphilus]|uniref:Methylamine utilization protein n=1 Tax=Cellvibrio fontiphilus TaxID=1815559 RepID=A0ABV7FBK7_9GAMM
MNIRVTRFAIQLFICCCFIYPASLMALEFTARVVDNQSMPLEDAVVALIPAQQPDYSSLPAAVMDQRQNMFVPHVLAIRTNTQVRFPNSDDVRHHVYSFSPAKKFELRLYHGLSAEPVLFDKAGTVVLGCNIHDSMLAYIYVVDTEYFAVTDARGQLSINAPAGSYQMQVFHPRLQQDFAPIAVQLDAGKNHHQQIQLTQLNEADATAPADDLSTLF